MPGNHPQRYHRAILTSPSLHDALSPEAANPHTHLSLPTGKMGGHRAQRGAAGGQSRHANAHGS